MSTAAEWFESDATFRQLCGDAQSLARSEAAEEFSASMVIRVGQHGLKTFLTQKQLNWLCEIADWSVPRRCSPDSVA